MKCKPCRVTFEGVRHQIEKDSTVRTTWVIEEPVTDGWAKPTGEVMRTRVYGQPLAEVNAKLVRQEAARQRRNRNSRDRGQAMRDLGMKRTPYGWE